MAGLKTVRVGILASGSGTTAESFIHATQSGVAGNCEVAAIVSNNSGAGVFGVAERAKRQYGLDIVTAHISSLTHPDRRGDGGQTLTESSEITKILVAHDVELVLLLGYMKKVRGALLHAFGELPRKPGEPARMLNTHPGPLPETAGLYGVHVQDRVIKLGLTHSAQTLHVVSPDYDTGPVVAVHQVPVLETDTADTLFDSVQLTEKAYIGPDVSKYVEENL